MMRFKYTHLAAWLKEQIKSGTYKDGDRIPTEIELAAQFGVSRDTVRKAISVLEKESLLRKIKGSGTYVRTSLKPAPSPVGRDSRRIGILMNDIDSYIFPSIVKGINSVLNKEGYTSVIQFTNNCISQEYNALKNFLEGDFAGLIIEPTKSALPQLNYDLYQKIAHTKPAVLIHAKLPTLPLSSITMGDEAGSMKLAEFLLENGHRDTAIFCKSDEQTGTSRYLGYIKAYQKAGLPIIDQNIFWFASENLPDVFSDPLDPKIGKALTSCSAIICHDDRLAHSLRKYLQSHSEYPGDIVICGFDNSEISEEQKFTSIAHPKEQFGEYAAMRLLEKIKDPSLDVSFDFNPKLIVRNI